MKLQKTNHYLSDESAYQVMVPDPELGYKINVSIGKVLSHTRTMGSYGSFQGKNYARDIKGVKYWEAETSDGKRVGYQFKTRKAAITALLHNV